MEIDRSDIRVIDNALPKLVFQDLIENVVHFDNLPWYFLENTAYDEKSEDSVFGFSWVNVVYNHNTVTSPIFSTIYNIFLSCLSVVGTDEIFKDLIRIRIGMITASSKNIIHQPHVDYNKKHQTMLIYLNDSEGDTHFYDYFYDTASTLATQDFFETIKPTSPLNSVQRVTPKANRVVNFNGLRYHSSSTPTTNPFRMAININYLVKE